MRNSLIILFALFVGFGANAIEGSFTTGCQIYEASEDSKFDLVDNFMVTGSTFTSPYTRFASENGSCDTPALSASLEGTVAIGAPNGGGVATLDQTLTRYMVTLHLQSEVDSFNERKLCNHDAWALESPIDVFDLDCTGVIEISRGDTIFTVFKLEGDTLTMGAPSEGRDGTSADTRHSELGAVYNRQ